MANGKISFIEKVKTLAHITRPVNVIMVVFGVFVTLLAGLKQIPPLGIFIPTMLAGACISSAGNAINDYYDIDIDRINRPNRPLPSGKITLVGIWTYAAVLFGIGILATLLLPVASFLCFSLALINSILLCIYAYRLKKSGFFGDLLISYLVASVFIFAAIPVHNFKIGFILAIAAFFTNSAREVLKDIEDIPGDKLFKAHTLPVIIGKKNSLIVVSSFLFVSILVSPFPYTLGILSFPYLLVALFVDGLFLYTIYMLSKKSDLKTISRNQRLIKFGALLGLVAFLAGAIPL